jgi:hypothetical protein
MLEFIACLLSGREGRGVEGQGLEGRHRLEPCCVCHRVTDFEASHVNSKCDGEYIEEEPDRKWSTSSKSL